MAALIAVGGMFTVDPDRPSDEKDKRVDWTGSALITAGLILIVYVLSDAATAPQGWRSPCKCPSSTDPRTLGITGLRADVNLLLFSSLRSHHRVPRRRRHLDCVVFHLERISREGTRREGIVDGLVATSSVDPWRFVVPRPWAVPCDSHDCILDVVFIPI